MNEYGKIDEEMKIAAKKAAEAEAKAKAAEAEAKAWADARIKANSTPWASEHGYIVDSMYQTIDGKEVKMWDTYSDGWHYVYPEDGLGEGKWCDPEFTVNWL